MTQPSHTLTFWIDGQPIITLRPKENPELYPIIRELWMGYKTHSLPVTMTERWGTGPELPADPEQLFT